MANILCLAHYCDTHGPTPLMVTEALPVDCTSCIDDGNLFNTRRTSIASRSHNLNEHLHPQKPSSRTSSSSTEKEDPSFRNAHHSSAIADTPPESPRVQPAPFPLTRDSSFRKTYDENDRKRANPCENCALTLPPKTNENATRTNLDSNGPILRTRKPYQRVSKLMEERSPPTSSSSPEASDSENDATAPPPHPLLKRSATSSSTSSSSSSLRSTTSHDHYLDYTSTHEPLLPTSFSVIRQSCLRTLSVETLPPTSNAISSPSSPFLSFPSSISTSTASGGPIFFGDPQAGYTIAFIFRIPDPSARGKRRQYALICHSMQHERVAMSIYSLIGRAFADLASWIQNLADMQLERSQDASLQSPRLGPINESHLNSSSASNLNGDYRRGSDGSTSVRSVSTSAFSSGRQRSSFHAGSGMDAWRHGGGIGAGGGGTKGKGLAELVGLPDFFFELHARFVALLMRVGGV